MRPMNYKDIDEPWEDFEEYKTLTKNNPIKIEDYVGKDAKRVMREKPRALTIEGFESFVYSKRGFSIHDYFYSSDSRYDKFSTVCMRIRNEIRQDQIEGGMAGVYNASITQRLNGLTDKQEHQHTGTPENIEVTIMEGRKKKSKKG